MAPLTRDALDKGRRHGLDTGLDQIDTPDGIVSALPPDAAESCENAHVEIVQRLHPARHVPSPSSSTLRLVTATTVPSLDPDSHLLDTNTTSESSPRHAARFWSFWPYWLFYPFWCLSRFWHSRLPAVDVQQASQRSVTLRSRYQAYFAVAIQIEVDRGEACEKLHRFHTRAAKAMVDFHCPYNLISRELAELIFADVKSIVDLGSLNPYPVVVTLGPGDGTANAIMEVNARWNCENNPTVAAPWLMFENRYLSSKFLIMERSCGYDVIIGAPDIVNYDLLGLNRRFALAAPQGFRSQPHPINGYDTSAYAAASTSAQQLESEARRQDRLWEERRDAYASRSANHHARQAALSYAHAEEARLGPGAYRDAYDREYDRVYRHCHAYYKSDFAQREPRPASTV